eukprot:3022754-Rhodomonas_salina.4
MQEGDQGESAKEGGSGRRTLGILSFESRMLRIFLQRSVSVGSPNAADRDRKEGSQNLGRKGGERQTNRQ